MKIKNFNSSSIKYFHSSLFYVDNFYSKSKRKQIFNSFIRKLIKISYNKIKSLDPLVHDYILLSIRNKFKQDKNIIKLEDIRSKIYFIEKVIEDLERIKIIETKTDSKKGGVCLLKFKK